MLKFLSFLVLLKLASGLNYDDPKLLQMPENIPVKVNLSLFVVDIKFGHHELEALMYFRMRWIDPRLQHHESTIVETRDLNIWTPDIFFTNSWSGSKQIVTRDNTMCKIKPNGEILKSTRYNIQFRCPMYMANFPFDTQSCDFEMESYGYSEKQIILDIDPLGAAIDQEVQPNWRIKHFKAHRKQIVLSSGNYSRVIVNLKIERESFKYVLHHFLPSIMIVLLSFCCFWFRLEQIVPRVLVCLFALSLMLLLVITFNQSNPTAAYIRTVDKWDGFCLLIIFADFLTIMTINFLLKRKQSTSVPSEKESLKQPLEDGNCYAIESSLNGTMSQRMNTVSKIVFPLVFLVFNLSFWI